MSVDVRLSIVTGRRCDEDTDRQCEEAGRQQTSIQQRYYIIRHNNITWLPKRDSQQHVSALNPLHHVSRLQTSTEAGLGRSVLKKQSGLYLIQLQANHVYCLHVRTYRKEEHRQRGKIRSVQVHHNIKKRMTCEGEERDTDKESVLLYICHKEKRKRGWTLQCTEK